MVGQLAAQMAERLVDSWVEKSVGRTAEEKADEMEEKKAVYSVGEKAAGWAVQTVSKMGAAQVELSVYLSAHELDAMRVVSKAEMRDGSPVEKRAFAWVASWAAWMDEK